MTSGSCLKSGWALFAAGLKRFKSLGFLSFCQKFCVALSIINYGEKLVAVKRPSLPKH